VGRPTGRVARRLALSVLWRGEAEDETMDQDERNGGHMPPMLRRGVTKPITQLGADGEVTILPRKTWLAQQRQLVQQGHPEAQDFLEWEQELYG
jgi:hypothetical protein